MWQNPSWNYFILFNVQSYRHFLGLTLTQTWLTNRGTTTEPHLTPPSDSSSCSPAFPHRSCPAPLPCHTNAASQRGEGWARLLPPALAQKPGSETVVPGGILQGQVCLQGGQRTWKSATALRTPSQHPLEPGSHISYNGQRARRPWRQRISQVPPQRPLWRHSYLDYCSSWIKWCIKTPHLTLSAWLQTQNVGGALWNKYTRLDKKLITESSPHSQVALYHNSHHKNWACSISRAKTLLL